jgi:2-dehydropantoate 2-reductase
VRIAVVGAGAMGSIFGARFTQGGHDTVLVDVVAPLVETIGDEGVTIVRGEGRTVTRLPATLDPASVGAVDIVVFFVKCYHTRSAAELARPLVGPGTVVASLQNGWGNGDVLASIYPAEQLVVGVTYNSGLVVEPGVVVHPADQPTFVGTFVEGAEAGAGALAEALNDSGLATTIAAPVRPEIWKKLILNAATLPASALTGMTAGEFGASEHTRALAVETAREATAVARALGYEIDPEERIAVMLDLLERAGPSKGSMVQDFEAGRRTEIDVISGAVVRAADEHAVPVPLNRTLYRLVNGWEARRGLA